MSIEPGQIIATSSKALGLSGTYRILQVLPHRDHVVLIPMDMEPRRKGRSKLANYYARGFQAESLASIQEWMESGEIVTVAPPQTPAWWSWSDEQIVDACPEPKRILQTDGTFTSPAITRRDFKWRLIEPLVELAANGEVEDLVALDRLVKARAKTTRASDGQAFDALHRFYAFGCIKNALLPNWQNCGAPGKARFAKNGIKLGRPNAAAAAGNPEAAGWVAREQDRKNMEDGYAMYVRPGTTRHEAFIAFSSTFYSSGTTTKHGMCVPVLLHASQRPTEREFFSHGPKGAAGHSALRRLMGEAEWARDYRPLVGSATSGVPAIGHVSSLDASPIDVNLRAIFDRLCPIGVGRGLFVREGSIGLWLGWYIAIGGLGTDAAKLAIYRAAMDKADLLKRLHLTELPAEDFVSLFPTKFLSDNGELRSADGIDSCVSQLASRIEFIERGRADRNSVSESGHHSRHRGFDHRLEGTTHGRPNKRGEQPAISRGLLNRYEYERLLALWIHWANTKQPVPHLVPTEMRRAMQGRRFEPTRINIYRWAKKEGYVSGRPIDPIHLKAHLLPTFTASVRRNGLVLHRPETGGTVELLPNALFNSRYLAEQDLLRSFGRYDKPHIQVKADPDDLSQVLLIDEQGIHAIPNVSDDEIVVREGCIADLCAKNDVVKRENVETKTKQDQDASDQRAFRLATESTAKADKADALAERGTPSSKSTKGAKVRENQAADNAAHLALAANHARPELPRQAPGPSVSARSVPRPTLVARTADPAQSMNAIFQTRLANFHKDREAK